MRDELANLVGVRVGLALDDERVDGLIYEVAPDMGPEPESGKRMHATEFKHAAYLALEGCGDPWTSMGKNPRIMAWEQLGKRRDLYAFAFDEIHRHVHIQKLGRAIDEHPYDVQRCSGRNDIIGAEKDVVVPSITDLYVLGARIDDLDEERLLGEASFCHGYEFRHACKVLLCAYRCERRVNPWMRINRESANDLLDLMNLFRDSNTPMCRGRFFDQRFIDFLNANLDQLHRIHWRQFERLVAEYLWRQGYYVELGPGAHDDGVDIRMWPVECVKGEPPLVIVQCKRRERSIEKTTVKALWADMQAGEASRGLVATTATLSPGATRTIEARGYGIDVADGEAIKQWLTAMRSPGVGISLT